MSRRDADDDRHALDAQTGWVGLLRTILTTSGPVALIASLAIAFLAVVVWGKLVRIDDGMQSANVAMRAFSSTHEQLERERSLMIKSQITILRQLCVNAAKNETQIKGCIDE